MGHGDSLVYVQVNIRTASLLPIFSKLYHIPTGIEISSNSVTRTTRFSDSRFKIIVPDTMFRTCKEDQTIHVSFTSISST